MSSNIDDVLKKWKDSKDRVKMLEAKIDKCKRTIGKLMDRKGVNEISGYQYSVSRRSNTRTQLSKSNIPVDIWNKYSTRCTYDSYHLKEM